MPEQTTAEALLACLLAARVPRVYGLIGTSIMPLYKELERVSGQIRYISARHELVAATMADAEGRLTQRPGIVLLHAGAGVLNGALGLAIAAKDCSPLLAIVGGARRSMAGMGGALEVDQASALAPYVKAFFRLRRAAEVPDTFVQAWTAAATAPAGPVVLEVPEDLWDQAEPVPDGSLPERLEVPHLPTPGDLAGVAEQLRQCQRPLLLAGGGVQHAAPLVLKLVESARLPLITTGNGRGVIPEDHYLCFGRAGYSSSSAADYALSQTDCLLCLGCGLSDVLTYFYNRLPAGRVAMINADGAYLQRLAERFPQATMLEGDAGAAIEQLLAAGLRGLCRDAWWRQLETARTEWQTILQRCAFPAEPMTTTYALSRLAPLLPRNTIVICGTGLHQIAVNATLPCYGPRQYLSACNFGAMGFAFGAAMATRLVFPERRVVCAVGDGDFMMTSGDLETAAREDAMPLTVVLNDSGYGTLRLNSSLRGFRYGSDHGNPDFVALAAAYGLRGARATHPGQVDTLFGRTLEPDGPQLLELVISPKEQPPANWAAIYAMLGGPGKAEAEK